MRDIAKGANERPLSSRCTPSHRDGQPVEIYRGWSIDKWTGWKGNTAAVVAGDEFRAGGCTVCGRGFASGDLVVINAKTDEIDHLNCSDSLFKGKMVGQWLAHKGEHPDSRMLYASVPGAEGEYIRGGTFDIGVQEGQIECTPETDPGVLECVREEGLQRLKALIDSIENESA
jgi:hypothetical protein